MSTDVTQAPLRGGPIEWIATAFCDVSRWCSLSFLIRRGIGHGTKCLEDNVLGLHLYILGWFVGLVAILEWGPGHGPWSLVCVGVAFYRLQDFVFATLDQALELTGKRDWKLGTWQAPVLIALVNLGQLVLVFAIAYQILLGSPVGASFTGPALSGHFGFLLLSWRSVPPLGSGYLPMTVRARVLSMIEAAVALLMVTITISRFLKRGAGTPT